MNGILAILVEFLFVSFLILFLFRLRNKWGLAPLYIFLGSIQYFQSVLARSFNIYIFNLSFSPGSIILFSSTLFAVLLVYIKEGVIRTRILIYGVVIANLFIGILTSFNNWQATALKNFIFTSKDYYDFLNFNLRVFIIGSITLLFDFFLMVVLYKFLVTRLRWVQLLPAITLTYLTVLNIDTLIFISGSFYEQSNYIQLLNSNLIAKNIAGIGFSMVLYLYLKYIDKDKSGSARFIADKSKEILSIITYRQKAEAQLAEKEQQLSLFVQYSPAAIAMLDKEMKYIVASKRWLKDYGLGDIDLTGKSHYEIFPDLPQHWKEVHQRCLKGGIEKKDEDEFVRANGKTEWVRWEIHPWYNTEGEVGGIILLTEVISERKKAENALIESEAKFRFLNDAAQDGIVMYNAEGYVINFNRAAHTLLGYRKDEFEKLNILHLLFAEDLVEKPMIFQTLKPGDLHITERRLKRKDGSEREIEISTKVLGDGNFLAIGRDITERKKIEQEIKDREKLFRTLTSNVPVAIFQTDMKGKCTYVNEEWMKYSGMSFEEAMGNGWAEAIHPADRERVLNEWTSAVALGNLFISELRFLDKKGNPTWLSVKAVPLSDAAKNPIGFIGMASDISKRIKSQEELKKTNEQLSRLTAHLLNVREEERKKIGREIHDELGQQLTAIKMNAAWIDKKTPATDTLVKNKLGIIIDLLDESNQSVHKILNELKPSILDEHALLEVIQRQCTEFAEHSGVKIYFSSIENELITSDEVSIAVYRVIQESLTNILRHANAKRVFILLKVINEQIHMTIEDDGVGFDSTKEKNKNSFGILGMAERIKALQGNFELISSPGKGTKLSFIIPLFTETTIPG